MQFQTSKLVSGEALKTGWRQNLLNRVAECKRELLDPATLQMEMMR